MTACDFFLLPFLLFFFCGVESPSRPRRAIRTQLAVITTSGGQKRKKGRETAREPVGAGRNRETIGAGSRRGWRGEGRSSEGWKEMRRYGNFDRLSSLRVIHPDRQTDPRRVAGRKGRVLDTLRYSTPFGAVLTHAGEQGQQSRDAPHPPGSRWISLGTTVSQPLSRARKRERQRERNNTPWPRGGIHIAIIFTPDRQRLCFANGVRV